MFRKDKYSDAQENHNANDTLPTTRIPTPTCGDCWENSRFHKDPKFRNRFCCGTIAILLLVASILIGMSLKKVSSTEYGVSYTKYSKKLADAAKSGGLYTGPPGFSFIKFPSLYITEDLDSSTCVSKDGLRVDYEVTFQYQMPENWLLPAILKYRDFEGWARIVAAAGDSAVQHTCSLFEVSNFQNKRGIIQSTMEETLAVRLEGTDGTGADGVYAKAISLQLKNVELPEEYRKAVSEKQQASEDIALAKNQRTQETTKARTRLLAAAEEAKIINQTAVNDADLKLTEARLRAQEISFSYETEANVLQQVREDLALTTQGLLAYMANRLYAETPKLKVTSSEPAKLGRQSEL
jgi:prohibitin 2